MKERFNRRSRVAREEEILTAAESNLVRNGCLVFSVEQVAAEVGIAKGTVYLHFPTREVLIRRTLERVAHRSLANLEEHMHDRTPADVIASVGEYFRIGLDKHGPTEPSAGTDHQLLYPCCLQLFGCPYGECDSFMSSIAMALDGSAPNAQSSSSSWTSASLAEWLRALIGSSLMLRKGLDQAARQARVESALEFIQRAVHADQNHQQASGDRASDQGRHA